MIHDNPAVLFMITVIAGLIYAGIGFVLLRREVSPESRPALRAFATWWLALSATTVLGVIRSTLILSGIRSLPVFLSLTYLGLLIICVALWGLLSYLVFLFTGRQRAMTWITGFYVAYFLSLVYLITHAGPTGIEVDGWQAEIQYERPLTGSAFGQIAVLLLVGPQILAGFALLSLLPRLADRTQRYRVVLIAGTFILWFGTTLVASLFGFPQRTEYWPLIARFIGLGATLLLIMAYFPPAWLRSTLRVDSLQTATKVIPAEARR